MGNLMIYYNKQLRVIRLLDTESKQIREVTEQALINAIKYKSVKVDNLVVDGDELRGTNGIMERYTRPSLTIINTIKNQTETVGFELSDCKGSIKKLKYGDCLGAAKQFGLTNAKIVTKDNREYISSITGEHDSLSVDSMNKSVNLINEVNKIRIGAKRDTNVNKVIYDLIVDKVTEAKDILLYDEEYGSIRFHNYRKALKHPEYSIFVTDMSWLFENCMEHSISLKNFNTSYVTNMAGMFCRCEALYIDLASINTLNVRDMHQMFKGCYAQTLNLAALNTSYVTDMNQMFDECKALTINLESFNTSRVTDMQAMFRRCRAAMLNLESFNTFRVTDMQAMFEKCEAHTINLESFDLAQEPDTGSMFNRCKAQKIKCSKLLKIQVLEDGCEAQIMEV